MNPKSLFISVALVAALSAAGCQHALAQASGSAPAPLPAQAGSPQAALAGEGPAPFATPPVLTGMPDVATIVARVRPAVVNILVEKASPNVVFDSPFPFPFDFGPFGNFHGGHGGPRGGGGGGDGDEFVPKQRGQGSGFIIDPQGHVVTNAHVVEGAEQVKVRLADDREFSAKVKGRDSRLDIAVLELQGATNLPVVSLGSSQEMRIGDYVVAIGNPFGLGDSVTMGILSAKGRAIPGSFNDFLQTDAAINPGNSGGPLFNLRGQVIGMNTAIRPDGQGIGFAIPSETMRDVLPQLVASGRVERGRIGVMIQPVDGAMAKALGLDKPHGALIGDVESGGPADKVGIHAGDVAVSVDGVDVERAPDLPRLVARHAPGTNIHLGVLRDKSLKTFDITLDALKDDTGKAPGDEPSHEPAGGLGIRLGDAPNGGALVQGVAPGGPAAESLAPGDVILEVNRVRVGTAHDAAKLIQGAAKGEPVLLKVRSQDGGRTRYVAIERR
jgi:serine protease Do